MEMSVDCHGGTLRCPFPIGWLINRGVCLLLSQQVNDDRWYTSHRPKPIFTNRTLLLGITWTFNDWLLATLDKVGYYWLIIP